MKLKMINNQRGDTIMEVLICVAMLGFMLGAAFSLTNRNQLSARSSQERSEAVRLAEKQVEYLRTYYSKHTTITPVALSDNFCFDKDSGEYIASGECDIDTNGYTYKVDVWKQGTTNATNLGAKSGAHVVTVHWDNIKGGPEEEVKMFYTIDQISAGQYSGELATGGGPPPPPPAPPVPATISQSSYNFPSWHLLNTGGVRHTRVFTLTNPSATATLNLTSATVTGASTSYSITSNGCLNRALAPLATCNLTVQFYPPSGGVNNRLSNAGVKNATVTINNSSGVASTSASLSGRAYSDQAGPGDVITGSTQGYLHSYNSTCYNNVEACGSPFTGVAGNGNLILGNTYCAWGGWGPGGYGNYYGDANKFIMQTDGNLVFYDPVTYRYASWTQGNSNLWLRIQDSGGGVYIASGSGGGVFKWIHFGGSCFAW